MQKELAGRGNGVAKSGIVVTLRVAAANRGWA